MALTTLGFDGKQDVLATSASVSTGGEDVILADVSGGTVTITLSSADVEEGKVIWVKDVNSNASTNSITIDTGGTETIDGSASQTIASDGRALAFVSDGSNWFSIAEYEVGSSGSGGVTVEDDGAVVVSGSTAINAGTNISAVDDTDGTVTINAASGGGASLATIMEGAESGEVAKGDQGLLVTDTLADAASINVQKATLTTGDVQSVPTGVDLEIVTFDGAGGFTSQTTVLAGDGTTIYSGETGSPLASYANNTGAEQNIGLIVNNQSGSAVVVASKAAGEIV